MSRHNPAPPARSAPAPCPRCQLPRHDADLTCRHCGHTRWSVIGLIVLIAVLLPGGLLISSRAHDTDLERTLLQCSGGLILLLGLPFTALLASAGLLHRRASHAHTTALLPPDKRQTLIETAVRHRKLLCRGCGLPIKASAWTCPHCGHTDWSPIIGLSVAAPVLVGLAWLAAATLPAWGRLAGPEIAGLVWIIGLQTGLPALATLFRAGGSLVAAGLLLVVLIETVMAWRTPWNRQPLATTPDEIRQRFHAALER